MPGLLGRELRKFDQVNRMTIPPKYKKELGDEIVIMMPLTDVPCLLVFSENSWNSFYDRVLEAFSGEDQAEVQRIIADRAEPLTVDKSGRISIGEDFKEFAGLTDEVLAVGLTDRVELWNPDVWKERNQKKFEESKKKFDFSNISLSAPRNNT